MTVKINVHREPRTTKPDRKDTGKIVNEMTVPEELLLQAVLDVVAAGGTIRTTAIAGTTDDDFVSGQLWGLDFDNEITMHYKDADGNDVSMKQPLPKDRRITMSKAIDIATKAGFAPFAAYNTFSHTEDLEKFRLLFVGDKPLYDVHEWKYIMYKLRGIFDPDLTDPTCVNPCRLFYGTNKGISYTDFDAVIQIDKALERYQKPEQVVPDDEKPPVKPRKKRSGCARIDPEVIEAIKTHDAAFLKERLNQKHVVLENTAEFFRYIYRKIDFAEFLGVEPQEAFSCVLPSHGIKNPALGRDAHPSANVFKTRYGVWQYYCRTEGKSLNLKQFIEAVGNFKSTYRSLEFIKEIFNLEIEESEWSKEAAANIDEILRCIDAEEQGFAEACPAAAKEARYCMDLFIALCTICRNHIYPERYFDDHRNPIFFASNRQLSNLTGRSKLDKTAKYLKKMAYMKMIRIVPDNEVPKSFLAKALKGQKHKNHITFYEIEPWVYQHMQEIETKALDWKAKGYRLDGISYEMFLRGDGEEVAAMLYPQTAFCKDADGNIVHRKTCEAADTLHEIIALKTLELIQERGYAAEADIIAAVIDETNERQKMVETQVKRSMLEILQAYSLKKIRATKNLKLQYGIDTKGYPMIIVME